MTNNINKRRILSMILAIGIIISVIPSFAQEAPKLDISQWAYLEMVDGERFGITEDEWFYDGFTSEISKERLDFILNNLDKKLEEDTLKKNENPLKLEVSDRFTRDGVLKSIFNIAAKYDENINKDTEYIKYLGDRKIVLGNGKDLYLDRKATTEETVLFAKRFINSFYKENDLGAKGLMWEVENNGNKVYLMGSVHLANSSIYPYNHEVLRKFNESDELLVEVNIADPAVGQVALDKMYYKDGTTLESKISKELYGQVKEIMDEFGAGEDVYKHLKPWAVGLQLSSLTMLGNDGQNTAKHGIDMYFLINANVQGKKIVELEGAEFQYNLFDSLGDKEQEKMLKESVDSILNQEDKDVPVEALEAMLKAWKDGDATKLKEMFPKVEEPGEMDKLLLGARDKGMAEKIDKILKSDEGKTYFVVVGAAHYVSDGAVVDILRDKGYEVKSLNK